MPSELVEIARFPSPNEASIARCALETEGVHVFVDGEAAAAWLWHLGGALGGVKLLVERQDAQHARDVLSHYAGLPADEEASPVEALDGADGEGEDELEPADRAQRPELTRAWRAAVMGILVLPPFLNVYSMWLLFRHRLLARSGKRGVHWKARAAFVANLIVFGLAGLLVWQMFRPPDLAVEPTQPVERWINMRIVP